MERAKQREAAAQSAIDTWMPEQLAAPAQRSRRNNVTRQDYHSLSGNSSAHQSNDELDEALAKASAVVLERGKALQDTLKKLDDFQNDHYTTYEEFRDLGIEVARPVAAEYKRLFISEGGDYNNIMAAYMAVHALNPLVAKTMSNEELTDALKDLVSFGFDELRPAAIQDLIDEIPKYRAAIDSTSQKFWSEVEGAVHYDNNLDKKKEAEPEKYGAHTWQGDRIEQARRVWEWWRAKAPKLHYFFTAARLVAIVPVSSAAVERAFSQVKFIVDAIGENVLEETLETRLMERMNSYEILRNLISREISFHQPRSQDDFQVPCRN